MGVLLINCFPIVLGLVFCGIVADLILPHIEPLNRWIINMANNMKG